MSGSSKIIWKYDTISTEELKACFPSSSGIVMIQASTKEAVKAEEGQFFLQNDEQYYIPIPINQGNEYYNRHFNFSKKCTVCN